MSDHTPIQLPLAIEDAVVEIPLTQGQFTYVDAVDGDLALLGWYALRHPNYPEGSQYKAGRKVKRRNVFIHRVILERVLGRELTAREEVDHEDRNPLNNRRSNLRLATRTQNNCNQGVRKDNSSGFKGVRWVENEQRWIARIRIDGKRKTLGRFKSAEAAHEAYIAAASELHGEFAHRE